jgi:hypothetical protein
MGIATSALGSAAASYGEAEIDGGALAVFD